LTTKIAKGRESTKRIERSTKRRVWDEGKEGEKTRKRGV